MKKFYKTIPLLLVLLPIILSFSFDKNKTAEAENLFDSRIIKVMSYNMYNGFQRGDTKRNLSEYDLNQAYETIRNGKADIIGLVEVSNGHKAATNYDNQPEILGERLGFFHNFHGNAIDGKFGNGILSKYPIVEYNHILLTAPTKYPGGLIEAKIRHPEGDYWFYVTHLATKQDVGSRAKQISEIAEIMNQREGPKILVGDLNFTPNEPDHSQLTSEASLVDPFGSSLEPNTFSLDKPKRLDYILANDKVEFVGTPYVDQNDTSADHFPLWADVSIDFINTNPNNDCLN